MPRLNYNANTLTFAGSGPRASGTTFGEALEEPVVKGGRGCGESFLPGFDGPAVGGFEPPGPVGPPLTYTSNNHQQIFHHIAELPSGTNWQGSNTTQQRSVY